MFFEKENKSFLDKNWWNDKRPSIDPIIRIRNFGDYTPEGMSLSGI